MGSAGGFGAQSNEALEREVVGGVGIGSDGNRDQEIWVGRDAHVVGVLRDALVTKGVGSGGHGLATIVGGDFGEGDDADELSVGEIGVECAGGGIFIDSSESAGEPEVGSPPVVEGDVVALVFDGLLDLGRCGGD